MFCSNKIQIFKIVDFTSLSFDHPGTGKLLVNFRTLYTHTHTHTRIKEHFSSLFTNSTVIDVHACLITQIKQRKTLETT